MAGKMSTFTKKRIFADVRELQEEGSGEYWAEPLEDNIFEWHFTIRGPKATDFEGGCYHGRILLPSDYPFKPPNIIFLTPNGRFEAGKKICLSISAYHPEEWQAAWGIRLILEALISFLPTEGGGAVGALDWSGPERRRLATASQEFCCHTCSCKGRVKLALPDADVDEGGSAEDGGAGGGGGGGGAPRKSPKKPSKYADVISQLHCHSIASPATSPTAKPAAAADADADADATQAKEEAPDSPPLSTPSSPQCAGEGESNHASGVPGSSQRGDAASSKTGEMPMAAAAETSTAPPAFLGSTVVSAPVVPLSSPNLGASSLPPDASRASPPGTVPATSPSPSPRRRSRPSSQEQQRNQPPDNPMATLVANARKRASDEVAIQRADLPLRVLTTVLKAAIAYVALYKAGRIAGFCT
mmetsp:Transcript_21289/g.42214  ORF Transcript_21289/g.42214 Transcript_21289/m.42214 type:complete len:415 (+) Transcript_21289:54-1298(+)